MSATGEWRPDRGADREMQYTINCIGLRWNWQRNNVMRVLSFSTAVSELTDIKGYLFLLLSNFLIDRLHEWLHLENSSLQDSNWYGL